MPQSSKGPSVRSNALSRTLLVVAAAAVSLMILVAFYRSLLDITAPADAAAEDRPLRTSVGGTRVIAVISRFNPTITYLGYQPLVDYLSRSTPYSFELRLGRSYRETVDLVVEGEVEAAFIGSFVYCESGRGRGIRPILRPLGPDTSSRTDWRSGWR